MTRFNLRGPLVATLVALALVVAWDASGLDLAAAQWFGTPNGFPWRSNHRLILWMHEVPRFTSWALVIGLFLAIGWPVGVLRRLDKAARLQLALTVLASVLAVSMIKTHSATSCPWDLRQFGGMARHVSHWAWGVDDGGPGKCFPAGHASAAFAYLGGWFVFRRVAPQVAWLWLAVALVVGFALGLGQQMRGAHYMSHTLWTAWVCWAVGLAMDVVATGWRGRASAARMQAKLNHS
ncbi:phosphoesterase [Variovorax sp. PAMC 28711]|nr:phosphoesterase [Variovorax sp. PAMC 28711]